MNYISPALMPVPYMADTSPYAPTLVRYQRRYRRIPLSRGRHHGGRVFLNHEHEMVRVESNEEALVVRALGARPDFSQLISQPLTVWFHWQGRVHRYTPDFEVWLDVVSQASNGEALDSHFLVEVKPGGWTTPDDGLWRARARALKDAVALPLVILDRNTVKEGA